jgi:hypothetical protein
LTTPQATLTTIVATTPPLRRHRNFARECRFGIESHGTEAGGKTLGLIEPHDEVGEELLQASCQTSKLVPVTVCDTPSDSEQ